MSYLETMSEQRLEEPRRVRLDIPERLCAADVPEPLWVDIVGEGELQRGNTRVTLNERPLTILNTLANATDPMSYNALIRACYDRQDAPTHWRITQNSIYQLKHTLRPLGHRTGFITTSRPIKSSYSVPYYSLTPNLRFRDLRLSELEPDPILQLPEEPDPPLPSLVGPSQPLELLLGALCAEVDPGLFFPDTRDKAKIAQAKRVCGGCAVSGLCLDWAIEHNIADGIWGGMTYDERLASQQ